MKRFYKKVTLGKGYRILLDDKPVRTPNRAELIIPARALAMAVAREWAGAGEEISPENMPLTRLCTSVTDLFPKHIGDARKEILDIAGHDLVCYRAEGPNDLRERQEQLWQPWLEWLIRRHGARFRVTQGVTPIEQDPATLKRLEDALGTLDGWQLMGLHAATRLTGSITLGLALFEGELDAASAYAATALDELYEIERWGVEEEQKKRHARLKSELEAASAYGRALAQAD